MRKTRLSKAIRRSNDFIFRSFDPNKNNGPARADTNHINNVFIYNNSIYFSGVRLGHLIKINDNKKSISMLDAVGIGTHNVTIYDGSLMYNDTKNDVISIRNIANGQQVNLRVKKYNRDDLLNADIPNDHAQDKDLKEDYVLLMSF